MPEAFGPFAFPATLAVVSGEYLARLKAERPDVDWDAEMAGAYARRDALTGDVPGFPGEADEFDEYLAEQWQDPGFRAAYRAAVLRSRLACPAPLAVDGHEYRRRQQARRRRRR